MRVSEAVTRSVVYVEETTPLGLYGKNAVVGPLYQISKQSQLLFGLLAFGDAAQPFGDGTEQIIFFLEEHLLTALRCSRDVINLNGAYIFTLRLDPGLAA